MSNMREIFKYTRVLFYTQDIKIDKENKLEHFLKKTSQKKTKIMLCIWKSLLLFQVDIFWPSPLFLHSYKDIDWNIKKNVWECVSVS